MVFQIRLHSPANPRELLALMAVASSGPVLLLARTASAWLFAALALLEETCGVRHRELGPRGEHSGLIAHFLPMLLFNVLYIAPDPEFIPQHIGTPSALAHLVLFQCCLAGLVSRLFGSDQLLHGAAFCVSITWLHFGIDWVVYLVGLLTVAAYITACSRVSRHLPGVFSSTEAQLLLSLIFTLSAAMLSLTLAPPRAAPLTDAATLCVVSGGLGIFALGTVAVVFGLLCAISGLSHPVPDARLAKRRDKCDPKLGGAATGVGAASAVFYGAVLLVGFGVFAPWMQWLTGKHPLTWVLKYIGSHPPRAWLLVYWVAIVASTAVAAWSIHSSVPQIIVRKVYHVAVVLMFVPAVLSQPDMFFLAYAVAVSLFVILEAARVANVYPLAGPLEGFMRKFTDERDAGLLITTHIYLLLGCALPHWGILLSVGTARPLSQFECAVALAGVVALGITDSAASVFGRQFGRHKWGGTKKTVEGTLAGVLAAVLFLVGMLGDEAQMGGLKVAGLVVGQCVAMGLVEAFTTQVDNLVLPLAFGAGLAGCRLLLEPNRRNIG